jgi:prepilin signal peptidase PulO-like enzyme (type II secretory pathway)
LEAITKSRTFKVAWLAVIVSNTITHHKTPGLAGWIATGMKAAFYSLAWAVGWVLIESQMSERDKRKKRTLSASDRAQRTIGVGWWAFVISNAITHFRKPVVGVNVGGMEKWPMPAQYAGTFVSYVLLGVAYSFVWLLCFAVIDFIGNKLKPEPTELGAGKNDNPKDASAD